MATVINEKFLARQKKSDMKAKDFTEQARAIDAEPNVPKKAQLFIETIVNQFDYPDKAEVFRQKALKATDGKVISKMAWDLVLMSQGLRKI